ncbi:MAG: murein hydrolase activator EnvC family protein [Paracoccaceae bacterium]
MRIWIAITFGVWAAILPPPALAESDPVFEARRAAEELQSATRALRDARAAKDRIKALSQAIRAYESGLGAMRDSLRRAAIRKAVLKRDFAARRAQLSQVMGVLLTQDRVSTPVMLVHPSGPLDTVRSGQILAEIMPAIFARAADLRARIKEVQMIEAMRQAVRDDLQAGLEGLQEARFALAAAIGKRTALPERLAADPGHLKTLLENSDTLQVFADSLGQLPEGKVTGHAEKFSSSKGAIPVPVFGTLHRRYGEADAAGLRRPGILVSAAPVSLVVSPFAATIRYLGPLLDYGNVIILEPEAGYLIVLAGLGQVYGEAGQIVSAGEPIGLMRGEDPSAGDFLVEASQGKGEIRLETMYIEIRQGRETLNPEKWFAFDKR